MVAMVRPSEAPRLRVRAVDTLSAVTTASSLCEAMAYSLGVEEKKKEKEEAGGGGGGGGALHTQ